MRKTGGRKSRDTLPLSCWLFHYPPPLPSIPLYTQQKFNTLKAPLKRQCLEKIQLLIIWVVLYAYIQSIGNATTEALLKGYNYFANYQPLHGIHCLLIWRILPSSPRRYFGMRQWTSHNGCMRSAPSSIYVLLLLPCQQCSGMRNASATTVFYFIFLAVVLMH